MVRETKMNPLPKCVLHVMNSASGGAALSTLDLIRSCREFGVDSVVVCHRAGTPEEFERIREAVNGRVLFRPLYWMNRKIRSPLWKRPAIEAYQWWRTQFTCGSTNSVAEFASLHDVDLIHTNTILTPEGGRAALRLGIPHVWHVRELVGPGMPFCFYRSMRSLGRYLLRHATLVVANSNVTAEKLRDVLPADRLHVVHNGIDISRFEPRTRPTDAEPVIVAMAANMTQWKKHDLFIEAAARVDRSLPIEFRMYGRLPDSPSLKTPLLERIERHQLQTRMKLMGFVQDPRRIMSEIDVLVHANEYESFGRVFVEAMAAEVPVAAVRGGAAVEVIVDGETGLLSTPDSAEELAANIERIVRNPELRTTMGRAGRRRAASEFSLERSASAMCAVYSNALSRTSNSLQN